MNHNEFIPQMLNKQQQKALKIKLREQNCVDFGSVVLLTKFVWSIFRVFFLNLSQNHEQKQKITNTLKHNHCISDRDFFWITAKTE